MFNIKKNDRPAEEADRVVNGGEADSAMQAVVRDQNGNGTSQPVRAEAATPSVLAPGAVLKGSIRAPGPLHLQGTVEGDVQAPHVSLGEEGTLRGRLKCGHFVLDGRMDGEVLCREFSAGETARISGTVRCNVLNLKLGAAINADVLIGEERK